jgi:hypothetical protein
LAWNRLHHPEQGWKFSNRVFMLALICAITESIYPVAASFSTQRKVLQNA